MFPGVQASTVSLSRRVWCFLWQPSKSVQFEVVSALLKKISVMVEDVGFTRGASFCLNLHPKTQVKCYHLLGAMPGMGIFALWSTEQNSRGDAGAGWDQCFGEQNHSDWSQDTEYIAYVLWCKKTTQSAWIKKNKLCRDLFQYKLGATYSVGGFQWRRDFQVGWRCASIVVQGMAFTT